MRFVELFAGIGGFSLGFERAGMECVGHVEIDPYAQKVLLKHWPDVKLLEDVKKVKGDEFGKVDLLCGGFPCQDLSVAGKQKGITGKRSGLFDEIIRIAGVCEPKYIVFENVANLLSRPDWFGYVLGRLAEIGYDAEWEIISAEDVGALHRKRVWIVAYPNSESKPGCTINEEQGQRELVPYTNSTRLERPDKSELESRNLTGLCKEMAYTRCEHGQPWNPEKLEAEKSKRSTSSVSFKSSRKRLGRFWKTESSICRVADGVPNRSHRLKCLGNALVPQISQFIGEQIMRIEN